MSLSRSLLFALLAFATVDLARGEISIFTPSRVLNSTHTIPPSTIFSPSPTTNSGYTCDLPDYMGFASACMCFDKWAEFISTNTVVTTWLDPSLQPPAITTQTLTGWSPSGTQTWGSFADNYVQPTACCRCWPTVAQVQVLFWPVETDPPEATGTAAAQPYELTSDGFI